MKAPLPLLSVHQVGVALRAERAGVAGWMHGRAGVQSLRGDRTKGAGNFAGLVCHCGGTGEDSAEKQPTRPNQ